MHKNNRLWCRIVVIVLLFSIVLSAVSLSVSAVDTDDENNVTAEDIEETVPTVSVPEKVDTKLQAGSVLNTGEVITDVTSYINYKGMTVADYDAFRWSFPLSQLAEPFSESLADVMQNDIVQQMRETELVIKETPDIVNGDYVYDANDKYKEYTIKPTEFKEVYNTITKNLRYNMLLNENGDAYTVNTLLNGGVCGKVGYISDMVYTNKKDENKLETKDLKNNITKLYEYDNATNASELKVYMENTGKLLESDPMNKIMSQRRLVPVLLGSDATEMYIQMGMSIYCKSIENMNFEKFLDNKGECSVFADSFGNIVFFDASDYRYKMILSNACNTLLTTKRNEVEPIKMYDSSLFEDDDIKSYLVAPSIDGLADVSVTGWNETSFMYNKLLGSVYSSKIKHSGVKDDASTDDTIYDFKKKEDRESAYYPGYIGPIVDNRMDYRNSFVLFKNNNLYPSFSILDSNDVIVQDKDNLGHDILKILENVFTGDSGLKNVAVLGDEGYTKMEIFQQEDYDSSGLLPPYAIRLNSLTSQRLLEGAAFKTQSIKEVDVETEELKYASEVKDTKLYQGGYVSVGLSLMNECYNGLLQTSSDNIMNKRFNCKIGLDKPAMIMQVPVSVMKDISRNELLGEGGGFLEDSKKIRGTKTEISESKRDLIFDTTYLLKRDNRISNRYTQMPKDDFTILFYTWLQEYCNELQTDCISKMGNERIKQEITYEETHEVTKESEDKDNQEAVKVENKSEALKVENKTKAIANCLNLLPSEETFVVTGSNMASEDYYLASKIGNAIKGNGDLSQIFQNPFAISVAVNPHATLMGLYRNTDPANKNDAVVFTKRVKEVDIVNLAQKIEFGIDNPIDKISNFISGLMQSIHNAIAVNGSNNMMIDFVKSDAFKECLKWYIAISWSILVVVFIIRMIRVLVSRQKLVTQLVSFITVVAVFVSVPYIFKYSQEANSLVMKNLTQTVTDKSTLIAVQKKVYEFMNKDMIADQNYKAYRQQFSGIVDTYAKAEVFVLDGLSGRDATTKKVPLNDCIDRISFSKSTNILGENKEDYLWYDNKEFKPVHSSEYQEDLSLYFYDYLMSEYLRYAEENEGTGDLKGIAEKFTSSTFQQGEDEDLGIIQSRAEAMSKLLLPIKGNLYEMFNDTLYLKENDPIGIANLLNQKDKSRDGKDISYLQKYFRTIDYKYKRLSNRKSSAVSPLSTENLKAKTGRDIYYSSYELTDLNTEERLKVTQEEDLVHRCTQKSIARIRKLLKYRNEEITDTAFMYTASMIISEEFAKATAKIELGIMPTTDIDKIMRVVFSKDFDNIQNEEALMYIVQDGIAGGAILSIFITLYELAFMIVSLVSVALGVFVSIAIPFLVYRYSRHKGFEKTQLIGYLSQMLLSYMSMAFLLIPLVVSSNVANTRMNDLAYWGVAVLLLVFSCFSVVLSFKCTKMLVKDFSSLGGSLVTAAVVKVMDNMSSIASDTTSVDSSQSDLSVTDSSVDIEAEGVEANYDEVLETEYGGQPTSRSDTYDSGSATEQQEPKVTQSDNSRLEEVQPQSEEVSSIQEAAPSGSQYESQTIIEREPSTKVERHEEPNTNPVEAEDVANKTEPDVQKEGTEE